MHGQDNRMYVDMWTDILHTIESSPMDFILTSLIKSCPGVFSDLIAKLANLSFYEGRFQSCFKLAWVRLYLRKPALIKIFQQTITQFLT